MDIIIIIIIMHGKFTREMPETVDKDKTGEWTWKGALKVQTEAPILQPKKPGTENKLC